METPPPPTGTGALMVAGTLVGLEGEMGNLQTGAQVLGLWCKACFFLALRCHRGNPLRSTFCGHWEDRLSLPSCLSEKLGSNAPSSRQAAPCLDWNLPLPQ